MGGKMWWRPRIRSGNPKSKIENPKWLGTVALVVTLGMAGAVALAQQQGKIFRIGFLDSSTASGSAVLVNAFRLELSKLRWVERKNVAFEYRFAESKGPVRVSTLAAELVNLKVDLIVVLGRAAGLAANNATTTIPIVMMAFFGPRS